MTVTVSVAYEHHAGPWTLDEVLALPEAKRTRIELVGGALMVSPAVGVAYQRAARRLARLLGQAAEDAQAPVSVLEAANIVVPDGLLIPDIAIVEIKGPTAMGPTVGPEDVLAVIEIASLSTRVTDCKLKPVMYAAAEIPNLWRVELEPAPRIYVGELQPGGYLDVRVAQAGHWTPIERPFPIEIDPGSLVRG
ncbi:Uma2 family endonuclease [Streptomyces sp. KR80]|uniref:Uma2 family endonuclease n=1 Tax=Streptomyces sp. KR80 TaxID=3457426 RepID=UPI003FD667E8